MVLPVKFKLRMVIFRRTAPRERAGRGTTLMSVLACANGWDTPWLGWGHLLSFVDLKYWSLGHLSSFVDLKYWSLGQLSKVLERGHPYSLNFFSFDIFLFDIAKSDTVLDV